jgi:hypothetical protein
VQLKCRCTVRHFERGDALKAAPSKRFSARSKRPASSGLMRRTDVRGGRQDDRSAWLVVRSAAAPGATPEATAEFASSNYRGEPEPPCDLIERPHHNDSYDDQHHVTTFEKEGSGTLMTMRMTLPDAASRAAMLATGVEHGMEASYVRLDALA